MSWKRGRPIGEQSETLLNLLNICEMDAEMSPQQMVQVLHCCSNMAQ